MKKASLLLILVFAPVIAHSLSEGPPFSDKNLPPDEEVSFLWDDTPQAEAAVGTNATAEIVRHSDVALMPEAIPDDISVYKPLHPRIIAWGEDPIDYTAGNSPLTNPRLALNSRRFKSIGIEQAATNVWMLTATGRYLYEHPEYQDAVCVDIAKGKIVPPWLDASFKGIRPWWGCTNNPRYRDLLEQRVRAGLQAGASLLHLDDHNGTSACAEFAGGCFCVWCQAGFRSWLKNHFSSAELAAMGISSIQDFRYADMVRRAGLTARQSYIEGTWQNRVPLHAEFLAFQREAATAFVAHLKEIAADTLGRPIPLGVNSFNLQPTGLQDAHVVDYWACEVQHFGVENLVPPLVYKLADALGKPAFVTGAGEDWVRFNQTHCTTRVRRWIAQSYAFGHYFMYAYRKWGFSQATGTVWTVIAPEIYRPLTQFLHRFPQLFDGYEPLATVGLIYSNADFMNGPWEARDTATDRKAAWEARDICRGLLDAGVQFRILAAGNDWLKQRLSPDQAQGLSQVIRPDTLTLDSGQKAVVESWEKQGLCVPWSRAMNQLHQLPGRITTNVPGRVWCLPRQAGPDRPLIVHLLNQDYKESSDSMVSQKGLEVRLDLRLWPGLQSTRSVILHTPESDPRSVPFVIEQDALVVTVPILSLWGVLAVKG